MLQHRRFYDTDFVFYTLLICINRDLWRLFIGVAVVSGRDIGTSHAKSAKLKLLA